MNVLKLKLCLMGDKAVGKTSSIGRFVRNEFDDRYLSTIGTNVSKKEVAIDNIHANLLIWDILGEEGFRGLRRAYFKGASGGILILDASRIESMWGANQWLTAFFEVAGNVPVVVFCNKWDLPKKEISQDDLEDFKTRTGLATFPTSAKTGANVNDGFSMLARDIIMRQTR